jgi:hypothetical protein
LLLNFLFALSLPGGVIHILLFVFSPFCYISRKVLTGKVWIWFGSSILLNFTAQICFIGINLSFLIYMINSTQGRREHMEDVFDTRIGMVSGQVVGFFAIYNGM